MRECLLLCLILLLQLLYLHDALRDVGLVIGDLLLGCLQKCLHCVDVAAGLTKLGLQLLVLPLQRTTRVSV